VTTSEILNGAADLIESKGWRQGLACNSPLGLLCVGEALDEVAGDGAYIDRRITSALLPYGSSVVEWNDTPGRTKEEVIQALRAAAKEAQS
jgi:hypothetical protein